MDDSSNALHILKLILEDLQKNHNIPPDKALKLALADDKLTVPTSIFVQELTILEAVTKHLKENRGMKLAEIARLLNRSPRSVWGSFKLAEKKHPDSLPIDSSAIKIPISLFSHPALSPSQILVMCLFDEHKMRLSEIAKLLHRDGRTIWTMYNTGKEKMHKEGRQ
ncbi:MAG TPA: hypothetical protein VJB90_02460 [Candidatus Nanoarchaeia archaeon]|nr:hypothetical protein [Candidatus Nanoarchaeia archaeon]